MPHVVLKEGDTGPEVAEVQALLGKLLCRESSVVTGSFDAETKVLVQTLQRAAGLMPTGEVDDATRKAIADAGTLGGRLRVLRDCFYCKVKEYQDELTDYIQQFDGYYQAHAYHGQLASADELLAKQEQAIKNWQDKILARQAQPDTCAPATSPSFLPGQPSDPSSGVYLPGEPPTHPPPTPPPGPNGHAAPAAWLECCRQHEQSRILMEWIFLKAVDAARAADRLTDAEEKEEALWAFADVMAAFIEAKKDHEEQTKRCAELKVLDLQHEETVLKSANETVCQFLGLLLKRVELDSQWRRAQVQHLEDKAKMIATFETLVGSTADVLCKGEV